MQRPQPQMGTQDNVVVGRIAAFLIDAILLLVVSGVLFGLLIAIFGGMGRVGALVGGILGPIIGLLGLAYFIYMEGTYGQTLGKRFMNIVVVTESGGDCDMTASAIRNVLRIVDSFPSPLYIVGFAVMYLVSDDRQRVGDIIADTVVVKAA